LEVAIMFDRLTSGIELARSSWQVLREDKKLIVFPIISGLGCLLVLISFGVPLALFTRWNDFMDNQNNFQPPIWMYVVAFAFYFCNYFVIVFCNAALISCALLRFNGESCTLSDGFQAAASRLPQILAWSLVSATVGMLLKVIENAHEKAGAIISSIFGTAWTIITYFVVPVLVVEKVGPFEAIRRSMQILRRTWGESLVGHLGLGLFIFLLCLPGMLLLGLGMFLLATQGVIGVAVLALGLIYVLSCAAVSSALNVIFLSAMYQYANSHEAPRGFDARVLGGAFTAKA
jgi:hypothetical protein